MKKHLCILGLLGFMGLQAQTGKVGINTETPTEIFDVNGTVRVRTLPAEGEKKVHTTGENTSTETGSQVYNLTGIVTTDANGVLGQIPSSNDTSNDSPALFVRKVYTSKDWPSGRVANTGFDVDKWDAILTINNIKRDGGKNGGPFDVNGQGIQIELREHDGKWRVIGDVNNVGERTTYTILFIKKGLVASDPNAHENPIEL